MRRVRVHKQALIRLRRSYQIRQNTTSKKLRED